MDRRTFLESLTGCMIATFGGFPLAGHLTASTGWAGWDGGGQTELPEASEESASAVAGPVKYPAPGATLQGYLARPQGRGPHPAVLLIHAQNGLDDQIRGAALRYSREGFVALAVDQLSRSGGTESFTSVGAVERNIEALSNAEVIADLDAAFAFLQSHPAVRRESISVIGFAWGARMASAYAGINSGLRANAVPFPLVA